MYIALYLLIYVSGVTMSAVVSKIYIFINHDHYLLGMPNRTTFAKFVYMSWLGVVIMLLIIIITTCIKIITKRHLSNKTIMTVNLSDFLYDIIIEELRL